MKRLPPSDGAVTRSVPRGTRCFTAIASVASSSRSSAADALS
jgi:hypothetical protein